MKRGTYLAFCDGCQRVHAFPRDMAERVRAQTFRHLIPDLFVIALVIGSILFWIASQA